MRVTLAIPSMGSGGAERVLTTLANAWANRGWEITLLTLDGKEWTSFYDLDPRISWVRLGLMKAAPTTLNGLANNMERIQVLRKAIITSQPQVVISFIDTMNVLTLAATRRLRIPVVISERSDPVKHNIGGLWRRLRRWSYSWTGRLVVQNQSALDYFSPWLKERVRIIPNPIVSFSSEEGETPYLSARPVALTAGRLSHEKGCDLLIQAFARIKDRRPEWNLLILGEGSQRQKLEELVQATRLGERVHLPGMIKNPYDYYRRSDLFVLPSRYEGQPNALCEAMACGLPVVAANCSPGVAELIQDGVNGLLAAPEDVESLASAMDSLMGDSNRRASLGSQARLSVEPFRLDHVLNQWENLISELV